MLSTKRLISVTLASATFLTLGFAGVAQANHLKGAHHHDVHDDFDGHHGFKDRKLKKFKHSRRFRRRRFHHRPRFHSGRRFRRRRFHHRPRFHRRGFHRKGVSVFF